MERDDLVDPVDELRTETLLDQFRTKVRGHDQDRILEIHGPSLVVGQTAVVEHLQQDVEHIGMRLFDLVEQDDRVRLPPDSLRKLAAFIVADISRRRADQPADGMPFLVFAHVDPGHHVLVVEQILRQRFRQFRLADARRAQEEETSDRPLLVLQAGPAPPDGVGYRLDGLVLPDHPLVEHFFDMEQLLAFALEHLVDRNARPFGHDLRDVLVGNGLVHDRVGILGLLFLKRLDLLLGIGDLAVAQFRHTAVVAAPFGRVGLNAVFLDGLPVFLDGLENTLFAVPLFVQLVAFHARLFQVFLDGLQFRGLPFPLDGFFLDLQLLDLPVELVDALRHGIHFQPQLRSGFIHQVDGLVGQEAVGYIAVRELDGRDDGVVFDPHLVVVLVFLFQATQDGDRFGHGRLVHHHHLEPALQRLVGLEILLVFVEGRRADSPQFTPRQSRLQDIGCVHRAARTAGAYQRMDLIDEEDDLSVALGHGLDDAFESFLEFALVFCACNQRTHVQGIDFLAFQVLRDIAVDDPLRDAFGNGGLADARLTDQDRIVLGPAAQNLQHPPDLLVPADDRIELAAARTLIQVDGVLAQQLQVFFVVVIHIQASFFLFQRFAGNPFKKATNPAKVTICQCWISQSLFLNLWIECIETNTINSRL